MHGKQTVQKEAKPMKEDDGSCTLDLTMTLNMSMRKRKTEDPQGANKFASELFMMRATLRKEYLEARDEQRKAMRDVADELFAEDNKKKKYGDRLELPVDHSK